jgi:hypothetical protein
MLSVADSAPTIVGVNVTLMRQFELAASDAPHALPAAKSAAFGPARPTDVMVSVVALLLVRVTFCTGLVEFMFTVPKAIVVGATVTEPTGAVPVPESAAVCGLLASLSDTLRVADSAEAKLGVKVMVTVQAPLAATVPGDAGQVVVKPKSAALAPVMDTTILLSATAELLLKVIACGRLAVPTVRLPKFKVDGVSVTPGGGAVPVPVRVTV